MVNPSKEIVVEIPMKKDEPLGATSNDNMVIVKVQSGTIAEGKLMKGDQIVKVNGTVIQNLNHFLKLLRYAPPVAKLTVIRHKKKCAELEERVHIPVERAKHIQRREGFVYSIVKIQSKSGDLKLGLRLQNDENRVVVSECDRDSIAAQIFVVGDHIIDVNSKPVFNNHETRDLLIKSINTQGFATCVIERPESLEPKHGTQKALNVEGQQSPSVFMHPDVVKTRTRESNKLKHFDPQPTKSIPGTTTMPQNVTFLHNADEYTILCGNECGIRRCVKHKTKKALKVEAEQSSSIRMDPDVVDIGARESYKLKHFNPQPTKSILRKTHTIASGNIGKKDRRGEKKRKHKHRYLRSA